MALNAARMSPPCCCRELIEGKGAAGWPPAASGKGSWPGPLLPELARLRWLNSLIMQRYNANNWHGIPPEWVAPGAFPRLRK